MTKWNVTMDFYHGYEQLNAAQKATYFTGDVGLSLPQISKVGNTYTFSKTFLAPLLEGTMYPLYSVHNSSSSTNLLTYLHGDVDVDISCSDSIFCNGFERLIRGVCARPNILPCDDLSGDLCKSYQCDETQKRCLNIRRGSNCSSLQNCTLGSKACSPNCGKRVCGDDGCSGSCGSCVGTESCVGGSCSLVTAIGSCVNPQPLFNNTLVPLSGLSDLFIYGDSSIGIDMTRPYCGIAGVPEYVYKFTVPQAAINGMGFEIRLTCADGTNGCDTVLAVHDGDCKPFTLTAVDRLCSDDQTPPGNVGSRVDGKLPPGDYTLVVTGYNTGTVGTYRLQVKFTPACYPKCEGSFCGTDGCEGSCGSCDAGTSCYFGRCRLDPCVPNCQARTCGNDGCGGSCGVCKGSKVCDFSSGSCVPVSLCDNFVPNCPNMRQGNGPQDMFCGSDCQWHRLDTEAPDLIPNNYAEMSPSISIYWTEIASTSCALSEGCVRGTGRRLLYTFDTAVHNIGHGDLIGVDIEKNPQLFEWASCHQHYHFQKFASFVIRNISTNVMVLPGAKLSYCMEDGNRYFDGPSIPCDPQYACDQQGIPRGRSDLYPGSLDCQWLDITDVERKNCWYTYEVCTNIGRSLYEENYDNNCESFPLYIPSIPRNYDGVLSYADAKLRDNADTFYPGCKA